MIVVLELWEAQNLNSQVFLSLLCGSGGGGGAGSDRKTLVLELWPKTSILRSFCHFHAGLGGGGGAGSDRKTLVLELWEAQNLNSQAFLSLEPWASF